MNYLTNYYKNLSEQLQVKLGNLEAQVQQLNEAPMAYGQDDTGVGNAPFSGAYLGQLLGQGNMADVYNYLGQYGGGAVPGMSALTQGRRRVSSRDIESAGGGAPRGGQQFSGAYLGQLLGQGNMNAVNQYLSQFGGAQVAGPALRSANRASSRDIESAGGGAPRGGQQFSGAYLGQLLGQGNMSAVNQYLSQFGGAQVAGPALRSANRPTSSGRGLENAGSGVNAMSGDYNGDGRVDGADLGLALGGGQNSSSVINNWSAPYSSAGPAFLRTTPGQQGGQGQGGVYAGGMESEGPSPTLGGAAGGPGGRGTRFNAAEYAGGGAPRGGFGSPESAGGGAPRGGFGSPESAGGGAPRGGAKTPNYFPTLGGQAEGQGLGSFYAPTPAGNDMQRPLDLPPLSDLNGDGRIDGGDLGLYMLRYGYAPPGYGAGQTQPTPGQAGGFTPINIGGYSPSGSPANRRMVAGQARRRGG